ncbi:MAG TPA: cob(I)yrinic acid a,c-diamide adenosyltransferase [Ignavibacteria bacterium]|nr:cob(I)yrinic acid a,c-diamide adenosyltransferase [Bacteroidota bacterium]HRI84085.1 cob(I)yrinic acid a,c-diamide adenosyltransferase [Ignavibacteria bacterium]HRK00025.1 cob(I)yrinic acid a,c-diamide adenosyltransferase [Ignavibacteria bacterium]
MVKIEEAKKAGGNKYKKKIKETIESYKNLSEEDKKCFHIYYGYGKGKTTCVMGLIMRALGAGLSVRLVQFDKGYEGMNEHYSELDTLRKLKNIGFDIDFYSTGCERMNDDGTFRFKNSDEDFKEAKRGLGIARDLIINGKQDLLILDEAIAAVVYHLIDKKDIEELIELWNKNKKFELVMTGHKLWEGLEEKADLITEMRKVKHYFDKGIPIRKGIDF